MTNYGDFVLASGSEPRPCKPAAADFENQGPLVPNFKQQIKPETLKKKETIKSEELEAMGEELKSLINRVESSLLAADALNINIDLLDEEKKNRTTSN